MKKLIILLIIITIKQQNYACDICGCGMSDASSSFPGMISYFKQNIIGVRYESQNYYKNIANNGFLELDKNSKDQLNKFSIQGRFYLSQKSQLQVNVPYLVNTRKINKTVSSVNGIGDISVFYNYALYNTNDSSNSKFKIKWIAGTGILLPNGKYQQRGADKTILPINLQTGTGAYQIALSNQIFIKYKKIGIVATSNASFTSVNELGYKFGNGIRNNLMAFSSLKFKKAQIIPQMGFTKYNKKEDYSFEFSQTNTVQNALYLIAGFDVYFNKLLLNLNIEQPLQQNVFLNNYSQKLKLSVGAYYRFAKKNNQL